VFQSAKSAARATNKKTLTTFLDRDLEMPEPSKRN
jgi:hypothetical protein